MYTKIQYQKAFQDFQRQSPAVWPKYAGPNAEDILFNFLTQVQRLPSVTTIQIAINELVKRKLLARVDGKSEVDDAREFRAGLKRNLDQTLADAEKAPLTREELDHFASLSFAALQRLYWGDDLQATDYFSARYRKAAREHGFQIPARPAAELHDDSEDDGSIELTAEAFNAMPTDELKIKMRNPRFKLAMRQLMKAGKI
jgi:hypothetical protein